MIEKKQVNNVERDSSKCCTTPDSFPKKTGGHPMKQDKDKSINAFGYSVLESGAKSTEVNYESQGLLSKQTFNVKPYIIGVTVAAGVIGFYFGLLTLVSDWYNATSQFAQYWGWIIALATGLGIQATLFTYIRNQLKGKTITAAKSSMAASGGISTASMAAFCQHSDCHSFRMQPPG